jgi:hypothetical protein
MSHFLVLVLVFFWLLLVLACRVAKLYAVLDLT